MPRLCDHSTLLGEPGKGSHAVRLGGIAAVDLVGTAGLTFLVTRYGLGRTDAQAYALVFVILLLVAILVHEAFCVNTRLNATLFGRGWPGPHPRARSE